MRITVCGTLHSIVRSLVRCKVCIIKRGTMCSLVRITISGNLRITVCGTLQSIVRSLVRCKVCIIKRGTMCSLVRSVVRSLV